MGRGERGSPGWQGGTEVSIRRGLDDALLCHLNLVPQHSISRLLLLEQHTRVEVNRFGLPETTHAKKNPKQQIS